MLSKYTQNQCLFATVMKSGDVVFLEAKHSVTEHAGVNVWFRAYELSFV
jgi:hypothetical protein